ncbi:MAG: DUF4870 domain-containing protein [Thermoanaerobaculia bacterium]
MSEPASPGSTTPTPPSSGGDSSRTLMLVLSYLGILALFPLLMEKDDQEVQWHAKHGLLLFGAWIALWIVFSILGQVPVLGCLVLVGAPLAGLAYLVVIILGIVKATKGERFRIPWLSDFADKWQ